AHPNPTLQHSLAHTLGDASLFAGNFSLAELCYKTVQDRIGNSPEELALLQYKWGRLHFYRGDVEAAHQRYEQALELAEGHPAQLAQIEAELRLLHDLG
ncbi:MAG: hypothetical protein KDF65_08785, partial [Anaerolineae bacterium]|nr:hypothetical protein [Anaerolineae bacterium]